MTLKKIVILVFLIAMAYTGYSQRYAVIDVKYIINRMPEYQEANQKLEELAKAWQKEIDEKQLFLDSLRRDFDAEQYMLNEELKEKRAMQISNYTLELRDLQKKYFGFEGDLFKQKATLMRPIQDKLYNTVQSLSVSRGWDIVWDKSEGTGVFYSAPKLNKSDEILTGMGIK